MWLFALGIMPHCDCQNMTCHSCFLHLSLEHTLYKGAYIYITVICHILLYCHIYNCYMYIIIDKPPDRTSWSLRSSPPVLGGGKGGTVSLQSRPLGWTKGRSADIQKVVFMGYLCDIHGGIHGGIHGWYSWYSKWNVHGMWYSHDSRDRLIAMDIDEIFITKNLFGCVKKNGVCPANGQWMTETHVFFCSQRVSGFWMCCSNIAKWKITTIRWVWTSSIGPIDYGPLKIINWLTNNGHTMVSSLVEDHYEKLMIYRMDQEI